jgi:hypothetical protein
MHLAPEFGLTYKQIRSDGFEIDFKATQTHYEYEYNCTVDRGEFNSTTNISITSIIDRGVTPS